VLCFSARELSFAADLGKADSALCAASASFAGVEFRWVSPDADGPDGGETVEVILRVADGTLDVPELAAWMEARLKPAPNLLE
jgi:hypothetical protein